MSTKHSWMVKRGKQICKVCGCIATNRPRTDGKYTGCTVKKGEPLNLTK